MSNDLVVSGKKRVRKFRSSAHIFKFSPAVIVSTISRFRCRIVPNSMKSIGDKIRFGYRYWLTQWAETDDGAVMPFLIRIGSALAIYCLIDRIGFQIIRIPPESFESRFIYFEFLKNLFFNPYSLILIPLFAFLFYFKENLFSRWEDFSKGSAIRFFIVLTTLILAWTFSTYDYNLYFNRAHYADRTLLLIFPLLVYIRPVFVLPFLTLLLPVIPQIDVLSGFSWTIQLLPIRVLILFSAFFLVFLPTRRFRASDYVFFTCCLFAAHYWYSGLAKMRWQWIRYDQLHLLLPATYANGWLGFLQPETVSSLATWLGIFNLPLKIFTLIVEFGAVLFFRNRHFVRFFLGAWIIFHAGIFAFSGILFWNWAVLEAALLWLFLRKDKFSELPVFTGKHFAVSLFLIVGGIFLFKPVKLAWYDSPATYTYRFEAVTVDRRTVMLPPGFFAPYEYQFTLGQFGYLDPKKPLLPITWGAAPEILNLKSRDEVLELEKSQGLVRYDHVMATKFDGFTQRFIRNWNVRLSKNTIFSYFKAPANLWTYPTAPSFERPRPISRIRVIQVTSLFDGRSYKEIRREKIREIPIN